MRETETSAKLCENCRRHFLAMGLSRPIMICSNKYGCEGKFFVVEPKASCGNFKPAQKPPSHESDGARPIPLTKGKFAIVDADDYDSLVRYKWQCHESRRTSYASRRKGNKTVSMHREIMKASASQIVDHIDGNGLKNRRSNLRFCTPFQNACNRRPDRNTSSKYKGVTFHKRKNQWHAQIYCRGKNNYLGYFTDQIQAALAYDRKAEVLFGEFAYLNFTHLAEFREHVRKMIFGE